MNEGKIIQAKHLLTRKIEKVIIAGMDKNLGITLVYADEPERIMFCMTVEEEYFDKTFQTLKKAIETNTPFDQLPLVAEMEKVSEDEVELVSLLMQLEASVGLEESPTASQSQLKQKCAFRHPTRGRN